MATLKEDLKTTYNLTISTTDYPTDSTIEKTAFNSQTITINTECPEEIQRVIDLSKTYINKKVDITTTTPLSSNNDGSYDIELCNPMNSIITKLENAIKETIDTKQDENKERIRTDIGIILSNLAKKVSDDNMSIKMTKIADKIERNQYNFDNSEIEIIGKIFKYGTEKIQKMASKIRGNISDKPSLDNLIGSAMSEKYKIGDKVKLKETIEDDVKALFSDDEDDEIRALFSEGKKMIPYGYQGHMEPKEKNNRNKIRVGNSGNNPLDVLEELNAKYRK